MTFPPWPQILYWQYTEVLHSPKHPWRSCGFNLKRLKTLFTDTLDLYGVKNKLNKLNSLLSHWNDLLMNVSLETIYR